MNKLVFDTEALDLNNKYIYNLGYVIMNEEGKILVERDYAIKQVYDNSIAMATAFYSKKRPLYTSKMKGRKTQKKYWGMACQQMIRDIKKYQVEEAYAYNSSYDVGAFQLMVKTFKNINPLNQVKVVDIMDLLNILINTREYYEYCKTNNFITQKGNLKKSAEVVYGYIINNPNYIEEHTALEDSKIEATILQVLLDLNEL